MSKLECKICGYGHDGERFAIREMMIGLGESFEYFSCSECACLQIVSIPCDMGAYYPNGYYSFSQQVPDGSTLSRVRRSLKSTRDRYAVFNLGVLGRMLYGCIPAREIRSLSRVPMQRDARILDVGCGGGAMLRALRGIGCVNAVGVDPYIDADVELPDGLRIIKGSIRDIEGEWDLVMFHHSFEHISDQLGTLEHVSRLLGPGGTCLIRVPTVPCEAWEIYGVNWVQIDAPRHLFIHSRTSLGLLAAQAGLRVVSVVHDSDGFQFWGSEQCVRTTQGIYSPGEGGWSRQNFSRRQLREFERRAIRLNRECKGDMAAFYLTR